MDKLSFDLDALESMHRFGDALEAAIKNIESPLADFAVIRDAKDCIGRHWYGMRCQVTGKKTGIGLYLHIGLIYYPTTRIGFMIELDEQNNKAVYSGVLQNLTEGKRYEINREEKEYFKLFMPDEVFACMSGKSVDRQIETIQSFVKEGGEAMMAAAQEDGFKLKYSELTNALYLANAFDKVLSMVKGDMSLVEVNYKDPDNFGQYAQGFRYYLTDLDQRFKLYAYFGAIYSYKKDPAGIFAEIDWFSNQELFDSAMAGIQPSDEYELSIKEPKFIKLFMREEKVILFNQSDYENQIIILMDFLKGCNDGLIKACLKGGNIDG